MPTAQPHAWQLFVVIFAMFALQGATLYRDAFFIKPAGDDFELVGEIARGDRDGPLALFTHSLANNFYRPSKSFVIWWSGRGPEAGRAFRIRLAHYVSTLPYLSALALWLRFFRLPWPAALAGALLFVLHPGLVATVSSIDGCGGMMASGLIWLGAWAIAVGRKRPGAAIIAACLCFAWGATWKEYIFALVPLAALSAFMFSERQRTPAALKAGGTLFALFLVQLPLRRLAMPGGGDATAAMMSLSPLQWIKNLAIAGSGLTFFGDTIWVFLNRSTVAYCTAGLAVAAALTWIALGLRWELRLAAAGASDSPALRVAIAFLALGLLVTTFPAVLHQKHFAEKYLCPLMLPFSVLCAFAFDAWWRSRWRLVAVVAVAIACTSGASAALHKNAEMRAAGEFAERQCLELLRLFEPAPQPSRILLAYPREWVASQTRYSVFRFSDDSYVMPPTPFTWWRPKSQLSIATVLVDDPSAIDASRYDHAARWDPVVRHYTRLK